MEYGFRAVMAFCLLFALILLCSPFCFSSQAHVSPGPSDLVVRDITCDSTVNPLGVDDPQPRFHWTLKARDEQLRNVQQTAFQILVASSRTELDRDSADVWDTNKISTSKAPSVSYAGPPLVSDTVYYWKVRVWDQRGRPSTWSETVTFLTGLLQPSDWHAHWIAADPDGPRQPQARGNDDTRAASTPTLPIFRDTFPVNKPVMRATLFLSGLGESEAMLNGKPVTHAVLTPGWTDYRKTVLYDTYDVTQLLHQGINAIGVMLGNGMYNVQGVQGRYTKFIGSFGQPKLIGELRLHYADGSTSIVSSSTQWKTTSGPILFSSIYGGEDYDERLVLTDWTLPTFQDAAWRLAVLVDGPGGELRAEMLPPIEVIRTYLPVKANRISSGVTVYDLGKNFAGRPVITVRGPRGSSVRILPGELLDDSGRVTQASQAASPDNSVALNYRLGGDGMESWTPQFSYSGFRYAEVTVSGKHALPAVEAFEANPFTTQFPSTAAFQPRMIC